MTGYFVTGTDTDVGKTVVCAWLMRSLDGEYWKPIQAGMDGETDEMTVRRLTGFGAERFHESVYRLNAALSPHEAARRDGVAIDLGRIEMPRHSRPLVVEGAGGLLVPLNGRDFVIDLIAKLALPVVLVSRSRLGTINHTLLSLESLRTRGIELAGVVIHGESNAANREAIARYGKIEIIAELPILEPLAPQSIADAAARIKPVFPARARARAS